MELAQPLPANLIIPHFDSWRPRFATPPSPEQRKAMIEAADNAENRLHELTFYYSANQLRRAEGHLSLTNNTRMLIRERCQFQRTVLPVEYNNWYLTGYGPQSARYVRVYRILDEQGEPWQANRLVNRDWKLELLRIPAMYAQVSLKSRNSRPIVERSEAYRGSSNAGYRRILQMDVFAFIF